VPDVGESVGVDTDKMYEYMRKRGNETQKGMKLSLPAAIMRRIPVLRFIFSSIYDQWRKGEKPSLERTQFML
jgi:hypothetical protein